MTRPTLQQIRHRLSRLSLTRATVVALVAATTTALSALIAFAVTVEDVTSHNGLATTDGRHLRWFTTHRTGALVNAAKAFTDIGSVATLAFVTVAAGILLWRHGAKLALAATPLLSLVFAGMLAGAVKAMVNRTRPPASLHLVNESNASFPSGHATDSTATLVAIALVVAVAVCHRTQLRALVVAAAGLLSAAIGWSRLELGVHWPTDVLAGWALGLLVAIIVTTLATATTHLTPPQHPNRTTGWERLRATAIQLTNARRPRLQRST